ncbi:hypothetical protein C8A05DRAFT_40216 [Staphylotrichum tortipilum]|uniref:Uncharacterized protein n=1 Tax=Staphylotrichum tortipilum TaxID=2831512 RepID=A0AAN6RXE1_9PEZI|nr:hypothetical protein C8A05DRAFT_40216 [Staphylotrichum longicolle]
MDKIQSSSSSQPREQGQHAEDPSPVAARRPSTLGRLAQNAETFGLNRGHHVRLTDPDDASVPPAEHLDRPEDGPCRPQWKPSIVLGTCLWIEGEDLNAIQIADRKVIQTRFWADHYKGVPEFVRMHQAALGERDQLDETAEVNTKPRSATVHIGAIQKRLAHLRVILQDSEFPPERANIEAAITGYKTGAITYSDSYTIIWAGRVVDSCPDFASFTTDRAARLDRYAAEYGPGWMWYEPPLSSGDTIRGGTTILAKKGICLENERRWRQGTENMGHYRIKMGFRRRKAIVARGKKASHARSSSPRSSTTPTTPTTPVARTMPQPTTSKPGTTGPDPDGPSVFWDMLLDTGATLPCLFDGDLSKLGISRHRYAAQSSRTVLTADSVLETRVYELDVCVQGAPGGDGGHGLSSPAAGPHDPLSSPTDPLSPLSPSSSKDNPASPAQSPRPTCTIPVVVFPGHSEDAVEASNNVPNRLSGIIPLHLCYSSSAPGAFRLWLGEDRRDVLGAGRLPANMGYGGSTAGTALSAKRVAPPAPGQRQEEGQESDHPDVSTTTPDRVIFEHEFRDGSGRVLRDEDGSEGRRVTTGQRDGDSDEKDQG